MHDVFCDFNVSFASHFSCTLQVNTVATVLLGLVVLFTTLAVKSLLFTNGKRSVSEMNRACSYFELQSRVASMGFAEFKAKTKSSLLISYSTLSQIENCYQHLRVSYLYCRPYLVVSADWQLFSTSTLHVATGLFPSVHSLLLVLVPYVVPVVLLWRSRRGSNSS